MKKFFLLSVLFLSMSANVLAQKSYIHIYANTIDYVTWNEIALTGDLPSGIKEKYLSSDHMLIGDLLNKLSEQGFEVELMSAPNYTKESSSPKMCYLLSKKGSSGNPSSVRSVTSDDDSEAYEVARYNLQGMPIDKNEKGVQIVVYSNYTTKTIIRE